MKSQNLLIAVDYTIFHSINFIENIWRVNPYSVEFFL